MSNHKIVFCKVIFAVFFVCFTTLLLYSSDHQLQYASTPESFVKSNSPEKPEIKPKPRTLDHSNLNCYTRPFQEMDYITVKSDKTKFAYAWYATGGNTYLCSALVAMKQMKALRSSAKLECEYVLLYSKDDESGKNIREDWQIEGK